MDLSQVACMDMTLYPASFSRGGLDFEASSRNRMDDYLDRQNPEHSPHLQVDNSEANEKPGHIVLHLSCLFFDMNLFAMSHQLEPLEDYSCNASTSDKR